MSISDRSDRPAPTLRTPPFQPASLLEGDTGRWVFVRELGSGGGGWVYSAVDRWTGMPVAIKVVPLPDGRDDDFRNEAAKTRQVSHPRVVPCYEILCREGHGLLVQRLVEGQPLSQVLRALRHQGGLTEAELTALLTGVLEGLEAIHDAGLVHRDVKPSNVMIEGWPASRDPSRVVILDLGLCIRAGGGAGEPAYARAGTPGYMPWEQEQDAATVFPSADIYALGVLALEAWTGAPPAETGVEGGEIASRLLRLSQPVAESILKAVALEPRSRWQHAREWLRALRGVGVPPARPPEPAPAPSRPSVGEPPSPSLVWVLLQEAQLSFPYPVDLAEPAGSFLNKLLADLDLPRGSRRLGHLPVIGSFSLMRRGSALRPLPTLGNQGVTRGDELALVWRTERALGGGGVLPSEETGSMRGVADAPDAVARAVDVAAWIRRNAGPAAAELLSRHHR